MERRVVAELLGWMEGHNGRCLVGGCVSLVCDLLAQERTQIMVVGGAVRVHATWEADLEAGRINADDFLFAGGLVGRPVHRDKKRVWFCESEIPWCWH